MKKAKWVPLGQLSIWDIIKVLFVTSLMGITLAFAIINKFW